MIPGTSIVMPCYECGTLLERAVDSVRAQTLGEWELLIVDDASSDKTPEVAQRLASSDSRISFFPLKENLGPGGARNRAIDAATRRFISFLDADDAWEPEKLERQLQYHRETGAAFSCTGYVRVNEALEPLSTVMPPPRNDYRGLLRRSTVGCLTAMYDRAQVGTRRMPTIRKRQDLALWLDLTRDGTPVHGIQEALARYTVRDRSVSSNKFSAGKYQWRLYREVEGLGIAGSAVNFLHYALGGAISRALERLPPLSER